jgi:hypothetical protein
VPQELLAVLVPRVLLVLLALLALLVPLELLAQPVLQLLRLKN